MPLAPILAINLWTQGDHLSSHVQNPLPDMLLYETLPSLKFWSPPVLGWLSPKISITKSDCYSLNIVNLRFCYIAYCISILIVYHFYPSKS